MTSLDNPTIKTKYKKCKFRVKRWESDFMEKHGRKPSKNDIRNADVSIKEAYKMYWNLKTQALEETLLDITLFDEIETSTNTSSDNILSPHNVENSIRKNSNTSPRKNIENIVPETLEKRNNSIVTSPLKTDCTNVEGAWGKHLNKSNVPPKKKNLSIGRSSSFQLAQNKFTTLSFSKRNPRKALSLSRIKSKSDLNKLSLSIANSCDDNNSIETVDDLQSFFNESIKVIHQDVKVTAQPLNPISQLIDGTSTLTDRHINTGWLERCSNTDDVETILSSKRLSGISDSGIESIDSNDHTPSKITKINGGRSADTSDDDFVCNSDTEEESRRSKRIRNWRKSLSDVSSQSTKRLCLEKTLQIDNSPLGNNLTTNITSAFSNVKDNYDPQIVDIKVDRIESIEGKGVGNVEVKVNSSETNKIQTRTRRIRKINKLKVNDSDDVTENLKLRRSCTNPAEYLKSIVRKKKTCNVSHITSQTPAKRVIRRSTRKDISIEDKGVVPITSDGPEIPIYSVESLKIMPRFIVPTYATGDLINEFSQSIAGHEDLATVSKITTKSKSTMTAQEKLEAKIAAGNVNDNFVRINLKKKVFARGKKSFNFSRYKKNEWRQKKKDLASSEGSLDLVDLAEKNTCFKCGGVGHFGKKCLALKSDKLLPLDENDQSDYPTLQEAEILASQNKILTHTYQSDESPENPSCTNSTRDKCEDNLELENEDTELFNGSDIDEDCQLSEKKSIIGHKVPQDLVDKLLPPINGKIDPLYQPAADGSPIETPAEVFEALKLFSHQNFRPGQEKAIMRILTGQSTLVTLSTGSGKSLCYQLPAYLYAKRSHCITLVVSPLVSLMDDQVTGIPKCLSAAALHTGQQPKVREQIIEAVKDGKINILLVSPEAVVAGEKSTGFGSLMRQLPPIAFVCIDEAHCISQWSHNFRPSYLMLCRVLMEKMGVKAILGLTATATTNTAESIVNHLRIHDGMRGVISDVPLPENLILTVSRDDHRDRAVIDLLKSKRFEHCDSIIIYCTRREECIRVVGLLRVSLQDTAEPAKPKPKAKISPIAEAYHAGLPASRRKIIQKAFMKGDTRIVVATVAFGMGINKSNIRSVIHYNMPSNFEGYVQEVGRAGRDNLPAHCHLFLNSKEDSDKWELQRHIHADGVDRHTIRRLLQKVFVPCLCATIGRKCPGHEVAIPIDETVRMLDISEETISTLLCYLELHPKKFITVLSTVYVNAKVSSYNGPDVLKAVAQFSPPLAMAIALEKKKGHDNNSSSVIEFPVIDIAASVGWDSGVVKSHLKNLEWNKVDGKYKRTSISVRYDTLGLRVRAPGDLTDAELDEALDALSERSRSQQMSALGQLAAVHASLNKYSNASVRDCMELNDQNIKKSDDLKNTIRQYFQSATPLSDFDFPPEISKATNEEQVINDIRSLICSYRDNNFTGRAIARIFHGIQSPNYSALTWSRCRYWRAHLSTDFNWIVQIATREILSMR